jgi:hypothetical protein
VRRRLTAADCLAAWRVDSELRGGHSPSQVIAFVSELEDLADERSQQLPPGVILAGDCEPKWLSRLRRLFGHY